MTQLFTDTSANLPIGLAMQHKIKILPFSYTVNGVEQIYDPTVEFNAPAYYGALAAGAVVKTAMINITAFYNAFREALSAGKNVLYLGMSGGISGTAGAAAAAVTELQQEFPNQKIAAVDTLAASLGEGLLVLRAAKLLQRGKSFEEVLQDALTKRRSLCQYFVVDDLAHLRRGGRLSKAAAVFGSMLQIKPLLTGDEQGKIVVTAKVRGRRQALAELTGRYKSLTADPTAAVGIAHANDPEGAARLEQMLRQSGLAGPCITAYYEPVTGAHVGPGALALFFHGVHK